MLLSNSSVDLRDLAYLCWGEGAGTSYGGGGTERPPNTNKETGIPRDGRTTCITRDSRKRVWKGATEEGARWGTLKSLHWGSGVQRTGSVDLRDPACSLVGAGAQKPENIRRWDREATRR